MKASTVILAAGDFPKKGGAAWQQLAAATRVVACDSAAAAYRRHFRKWPTVIVGDMDSLGGPRFRAAAHAAAEVVRIPDQETNDLEKAMALCARRGWRAPVIVGATGKREDHTIGNVFRALAARLPIVSDFGTFYPVCGKKTLRTQKGQAVSVFAPDPRTRMTSKGLVWPLDGVCLKRLYTATLNRAAGKTVTVTSDRPVTVYVEAEDAR